MKWFWSEMIVRIPHAQGSRGTHSTLAPATVRSDLADWLAHIECLHRTVIDPGLARVRVIQERLHLYPDYPVIVVGGTNGKGSTCAMLEAILLQAGFNVGLYSSPHLLRYNERVRSGGRDATDAELCASFAEIERARQGSSLTYFEFGTLAAVAHFRACAVDVAVLEVGMGGRLDAVNAFDADCAIVTGVDIDHVDFLGATREKIGFEKAGIFRRGRPAIYGEASIPVSVSRHARAIGADLIRAGRDFVYERGGSGWHLQGRSGARQALPYPALVGDFQLANASAAIVALEALGERLPVPVEAVRSGLRATRLAGRYQVLRKAPEVIIDVAHNPQSAKELARMLTAESRSRQTLAVCGMLADKDMPGVIDHLKHCIDGWHVGTLDQARGATAEQLGRVIEHVGVVAPVWTHPTPLDAYSAALTQAEPEDRIIVFGSFHTVAAILQGTSRHDE